MNSKAFIFGWKYCKNLCKHYSYPYPAQQYVWKYTYRKLTPQEWVKYILTVLNLTRILSVIIWGMKRLEEILFCLFICTNKLQLSGIPSVWTKRFFFVIFRGWKTDFQWGCLSRGELRFLWEFSLSVRILYHPGPMSKMPINAMIALCYVAQFSGECPVGHYLVTWVL
jgi:hypothetical protein